MENRGITAEAAEAGREGQAAEAGTRSMAVTGARKPVLAERLLVQVAESLWLPAHESEEERTDRIRAAVAAVAGLAPRDELEGMLAVQMAATHAAAMECLRRAAMPYSYQDRRVRDDELRQAGRLLGLYARQVEVLNHNRGRAVAGPGGGSGQGGAAGPAPAEAAR